MAELGHLVLQVKLFTLEFAQFGEIGRAMAPFNLDLPVDHAMTPAQFSDLIL
jgi:hypothetical protein